MVWPAYGQSPQNDGLERPDSPPDTSDYYYEVAEVHEQPPLVEIRDLLRRLYGSPEECGESNPYIAPYRRMKGTAVLRSAEGGDKNLTIGVADFGYWSALDLGYIENVRVHPDIRRKGLGQKLLKFGVDYMCGKGIHRIYSFAVNPEGYKLLEGGGFTPRPADDPERPWRTWFVLE
jgi:GNAT superfamily N-acetyltransferase